MTFLAANMGRKSMITACRFMSARTDSYRDCVVGRGAVSYLS
jgi:hypothetical protein